MTWNEALKEQKEQLPEIQAMYKKHGLTIEGGGACPEEYRVFKGGKLVAYYWLRHGNFRVGKIKYPNTTIKVFIPNGDGMFDTDERLKYMELALGVVKDKL